MAFIALRPSSCCDSPPPLPHHQRLWRLSIDYQQLHSPFFSPFPFVWNVSLNRVWASCGSVTSDQPAIIRHRHRGPGARSSLSSSGPSPYCLFGRPATTTTSYSCTVYTALLSVYSSKSKSNHCLEIDNEFCTLKRVFIWRQISQYLLFARASSAAAKPDHIPKL